VIRWGWRPIPLFLLLLLAVVEGACDVASEWPDAANTGQKLATIAQAAYVVAAAAGLAGIAARRTWARPALWIWAGFTTVTALLAAMFWGEAGLFAGFAGAAACAALCVGVIALALSRPRRERAGDAS
jgi:uncharacterized membrane protein